MIQVLIGMIGSGKTTYARERAKQGAIVVCHDSLTESLHAEYRYEQGLREFYRDIEAFIVKRAVREWRRVVIDRTHLTRESRQRWVELARSLHVEIEAVVFPGLGAETHARNRFNSDARGRTFETWLGVARHHEAQLQAEPLDWRAEGFDRLVYPILSAPKDTIQEVT